MLEDTRLFRRDESGVSEVVGSILTLSITVILFTSVFASLSYLETPEKSVRVDFDTTFEIAFDGNSYWINLTHKGGHDLRALDTDIYLIADSTYTVAFRLSDLEDDDALELDGEDDSHWTIAEELVIHSDEPEVLNSYDLELMIVDQSSNSVIWRKDMFEPGGPIIIRKTSVEYSLTHPWKDYAEQGDVVTLNAEIVAPGIEPHNLTVIASTENDILNRSYFDLEYARRSNKGYEFEASCTVDDGAESGSYRIKFIAEKDKTIKNRSAVFTNINIGELDTSHLTEPDLVVGDIEFTPESPTDSERVKVSTNIYNNGGYNTYSNVTFFDNHSGLDEAEQIGPTIENVSFPTGPAPREVSVSYMVNREGTHEITVYVGNGRGDDRYILVNSQEFGWEEKEDNNWEDNSRSELLHVKPRILVVNDHQDSEVYDTEHMTNALSELDYTYEVYNVRGGINQDGPSEEKLSNFGVTIWMTGEQSLLPLTVNDRSNLDNYIDEGGKVWLLGGNIHRVKTSFLNDNFGITSVSNPQSFSSPLRSGLLDETNGNGTYGEHEYSTVSDTEGGVLTGDFESYNELYEKGVPANVFGAGYELQDEKTRTAANSFLFEAIKSSNMRTTMADRVIEWLTNMTSRGGVDISVSSQSITPSAPMFKDEVYVNATLRNNGAENISVPVRMQIDDNFGLVRAESGESSIEIPARSTENVTFRWTAEPVGLHRLKVIADPYDEIEEANEANNDITYKNLSVSGDQVEVNVHFSILVVDDESRSNGDPYVSNTTDELIKSMKELDYQEERDYDIFYTGGGEEDHGPTAEIMRNYNAVYWVTGENPGTLTEKDVDELIGDEGFLDRPGSNLMMIGENILQNLSEVDYGSKMIEKLGVDAGSIVDDDSNPSRIYGQYRDPISHGMKYTTDDIESIDSFYGTNDSGRVLFRDQDGKNISSAFDDGRNKVVFFGMDISRINGPVFDGDPNGWPAGPIDTSGLRAREEMVYMISREFGKIDESPELRVSELDIEFGSDHPMLTKSYTIKARIENVGFDNASCLVRFYDGEDYIGSKSPTILPSKRETGSASNYFITTPGSATLEIGWEPSFAGNRTITVQVDPLDEVTEVRNGFRDDFEFNNQAQIEQKVYYFWDDMENGTGNWRHDANILSINGEGESEIDYLTGKYDELDTDVIGEWDWSKTSGVENTTMDSHSDPSSYYMEEPVGKIGRRADVFVAIVIDGSNSMKDHPTPSGISRLMAAQQGALTLIDQLSNESVVLLMGGQGTNPNVHKVEGRAYHKLTPSNRSDLEDELTTENALWWDGGQTPLWDAVGTGYWEIMHNYSHVEPDLSRATVVLSDGCDLRASDTAAILNPRSVAFDRAEQNSNEWAPWHSMDAPTYTEEPYDKRIGKYQLNDYREIPGYWGWVYPTGGTRKGLLDSHIPIFTIGLGLEHYEDIPNWDAVTRTTRPVEEGNYWNEEDNHVYVNPSDPAEIESGTVEYNLWRIANTSDAEYYYSENGSDLGDIFGKIGTQLVGPQNLSSVGGDNTIKSAGGGGDDLMASEPEPTPTAFGNSDKKATTPEMDLTNMSSAWLTFWHRYRLIQGVNGAYIEVGYYNETNNEMNWTYIEPSIGPYTGNLLEGREPTDDNGNEIKWCWNGKSGEGTEEWDYVKVNLLKDEYNIPNDKLDTIRVRFYYKQYGGATVEGGWYIDDVNVRGTRRGDRDTYIDDNMKDVWQIREEQGYDGKTTNVWWNGWNNSGNEEFKGGIDNRLTTTTIDLTTAETATLSAKFRFNINSATGSPPDGFRVEISDDGGKSWMSIGLGERAAEGVSGTDESSDTTVTGHDIGFHWTNIETMYRLEGDLSAFAGETILLRFRVVTSSGSYLHYEDNSHVFGGFSVDDVIVSGESEVG